MLAKKYRLPIGAAPLKKQYSRPGDYFTFKERESGLPHRRFGVVISKKVHKSAVRRNKLKRTICNFIRTQKIHLRPGSDILIVASPRAALAGPEEIQGELEKFLK